jgi:hypothetical protein
VALGAAGLAAGKKSLANSRALVKLSVLTMNWWDKLSGRLAAPKLTRGRMVLALFAALAADGLQIPFAAPPATEIIDVVAMLVTVFLLGFHFLLLPTFVLEFIPIAGMLPTWTACVGAVIVLRKRQQTTQTNVIDVESSRSAPTPPAPVTPSNSPPSAPPPPASGAEGNPS